MENSANGNVRAKHPLPIFFSPVSLSLHLHHHSFLSSLTMFGAATWLWFANMNTHKILRGLWSVLLDTVPHNQRLATLSLLKEKAGCNVLLSWINIQSWRVCFIFFASRSCSNGTFKEMKILFCINKNLCKTWTYRRFFLVPGDNRGRTSCDITHQTCRLAQHQRHVVCRIIVTEIRRHCKS